MTTETTTYVCPVERTFGLHTFRCVRAADGHTECEFPVDATVYQRPLDDHDAAWLASEVRMLHGQIASMKREAAKDDTLRRYQRVVGRLMALAPANAKRKTVATEDVQRVWMDAINGQ